MSDTAALRRRIESGEQDTLTAAEYVALATAEAKRGNKFGAVRTEVDGIMFDSAAEARRWGELQLRFRAGEITSLQRQYGYRFEHNGVYIGSYIADFRYYDQERSEWIVEDVKGGEATKTALYRWKKKLLWAFHRVRITEVP